MIEVKQSENLRMLTQSSDFQERVFENIKSEINTHQHQSIGIGRRMPVPDNLDGRQVVKLQRQLMDRLIQIYAKNSQDVPDVYSIHKVCQCVADDELFAETGIEPEVLEIFSYYNKQMVNELRSERSASYDYLQKNSGKGGSEFDEESQGSVSW